MNIYIYIIYIILYSTRQLHREDGGHMPAAGLGSRLPAERTLSRGAGCLWPRHQAGHQQLHGRTLNINMNQREHEHEHSMKMNMNMNMNINMNITININSQDTDKRNVRRFIDEQCLHVILVI